jgi:hypothetical protein
MNNRLFTLLIFLLLLPFFGWMFYDWQSDSKAIEKDGTPRDALVDQGGEQSASVQFIFHFPNPVYSHALSTAQIEQLSQSNAEAENYHIYGLTQAGYSSGTLYEVNWSKSWFKPEYKMWVENLRVEFTYDTLNVYVTNAYPEGSCEYQATLDHENQHVAIHRKLYEQYQKVFQEAIEHSQAIPLASNPIVVGSIPEGKKRIGDILSAVLDPPFNQFKDTVQAEQATLDTPENYAALKGQCQNW